MSARSIDVSQLPTSGFGTRSLAWWGTTGFMLIEGTTLALCASTYLYLSRHFEGWPPLGTEPPELLVPTISAAVLLASVIPALLLRRAAHEKNDVAIRNLLLLLFAWEVVNVALRALEFGSLNTRYDSDAYGSIVWFTVGFHGLLIATDMAECGAFAAIFLLGKQEEKHYADADEVALYDVFIAASWVPLYALLYLSPYVF